MKLYLAGMSGPGSFEDLKELIEPIKAYKIDLFPCIERITKIVILC